MIAEISTSTACGTVAAPPSKSVAHRALICGALSGGSKITNVAFSKDIEATLGCLKALGASVNIEADTVTVGGLDPQNITGRVETYCNESGSTLRFMIPLCMLSNAEVSLGGSERLLQRPLTVYEDIAKANDITFSCDAKSVNVKGKIKSGVYKVPGDISSQFITGLMFALPLLPEDSKIEVTGRFESASYVDITVKVLRDFGVEIIKDGNVFIVPGNQKYSACEYRVEGDCSNAAFLDAFNFIGSNVQVLGLNEDTVQGDRVYADIFRQMKLGIRRFDLSDCPDLAPVLFALAAALGGDYRFDGTARLKIKESDRAAAMAEELAKFGVEVQVEDNSVYICPCNISTPAETLSSHNDHRIAMSLALLCSLVGGSIEGAEAVEKSYPNFFNVIKSIGIGLVLK